MSLANEKIGKVIKNRVKKQRWPRNRYLMLKRLRTWIKRQWRIDVGLNWETEMLYSISA